MLNQFKSLIQLNKIKEQIEKQEVVMEKKGVKIIINGKMEVKEIKLNPQLEKGEQEKVLKESFNEAIKKIQKEMAQKFLNLR